MGGPITTIEVQEAIRSLQNNKSPGPDGFTTEYYKTFSDLLAPMLRDMYNEAFLVGRLPDTLSTATISLILKKGKDPLSCQNYRPISLLNVDFKILSKILALRLQRVLPSVISLDQTGFMPDRQSSHNTRRLLNILHSPSSEAPEIVLSLDAEKAFDRVEWLYLYEVLERFGLDNNFIQWVRLLYSAPMASVLTNDTLSPSFSLQRGTRQGCPLSPLLFAIAIEPLALWLRSEIRFEGLTRSDTLHKVSLYADDLLLYISNPSTSLPAILNILEQFGAYSGYKLNYQKSEVFPINLQAKQLSHSFAPFKLADDSFRYLGIVITASLPDMFKANFLSLAKRIEDDLNRWTALPLSLIGRVNLIKMVVMPKFLYLFQHIPIFISRSFFNKLDGIISRFLWGPKPARIRRTILQSPKRAGGLSLPNFRMLYWAANVQKMLFWMDDTHSSLPIWSQLELSASHVSLRSVLCSPLPLPLTHLRSNPIVSASLKIWNSLRKTLGLQGPSLFSPLFKNHAFRPSITDPTFKIWHNKGIICVMDLYSNDIFSSFAELSTKHNLPSSHLFRFFQIRDFIKKNFPYFPSRPRETLTDTLLAVDPRQKKCISLLYNHLCSATPAPINLIRSTWENDLNIVFTDQQWTSALDLVHSSSICARHALIQCKILHRTHYTNAKLARIYPSVQGSCNRCRQSPATHGHMFWSCPKLAAFWQSIFDTIGSAYNHALSPNPMSAVFGSPPDTKPPFAIRRALTFTTLLARRLILLDWKLARPPSYSRWVKEVLCNLKLEKLRSSLNGSTMRFHETWDPLLEFFKTPNLAIDEEV